MNYTCRVSFTFPHQQFPFRQSTLQNLRRTSHLVPSHPCRALLRAGSPLVNSESRASCTTTISKHINHLSSSFSNRQRIRPTMSVTRSTDPLVWIDCEMTGLDPTKDTILSISCYITNHLLELVEAKGYHATISTPASVLSSMNDWCIRIHTATGLVNACQSSSAISASRASAELLEYIKGHVSESRTALLAGNSVHADKMFLMQKPWTSVLEWLHYRILDVSAIKEAMRRWASQDILDGAPKKRLAHSADEDIRESLEEARYYMQLIQKLGRP